MTKQTVAVIGASGNRVYQSNALPGQWRGFNFGFRCAKNAS